MTPGSSGPWPSAGAALCRFVVKRPRRRLPPCTGGDTAPEAPHRTLWRSLLSSCIAGSPARRLVAPGTDTVDVLTGRAASIRSHPPLSDGRTALALQPLGGMVGNLFERGEFAAALPLAEAAVNAFEQRVPDSLLLSKVLGNLGAVLAGLTRFADSLLVAQRALGILEALADVPSAELALALNNVGTAQVRLGDAAAAEPYLRQAVDEFERGAPDHPSCGLVRTNLAHALRRMGRIAEADSFAEHAGEWPLPVERAAGLRGCRAGRYHPSAGRPQDAQQASCAKAATHDWLLLAANSQSIGLA